MRWTKQWRLQDFSLGLVDHARLICILKTFMLNITYAIYVATSCHVEDMDTSGNVYNITSRKKFWKNYGE